MAQDVVVPLREYRKSRFGDVNDDAWQVCQVFALVLGARISLKMEIYIVITFNVKGDTLIVSPEGTGYTDVPLFE